ncbi:hypothetical protein M426DRAFT_262353 [Hypoxylon sp. CI-4A]|nr:hypothetical protein M426DRAFT_262353 [Hypoxylon sp. CI-4A]
MTGRRPNLEDNNDGNTKKACYNCTKRRIICDKTGNSCNKCAKKNLTCPGYGIRYRFATGSTTAGGSSQLQTQHSGTNQLGSRDQKKVTRWINYSKHVTETRLQRSAAPESISLPSTHLASSVMTTVPPLLSDIDPRTRVYFLHCNSPFTRPTCRDLLTFEVAVHVSPFMVVFDDEANGYRHNVLPMAHKDPLIQRAVCVVAAFHLSQKEPRLRASAEIVRADLISKLSRASVPKPDLSETTWAALVLLIVADLVTGHEDVSALYDLLAAFLDARGPLGESATRLERFLYFQSSISIGFFTSPFAILELRPVHPPHMRGGPVSAFKEYMQGCQFSKEKAEFQRYCPIYEKAFHVAGEIYTMRMNPTCSGADLDLYMSERLQKLRALCEQRDRASPGSHCIAWPIFVAAAESYSDCDRQYFASALSRIWEENGYANVARGVAVLPDLWAQRGRKSWVAALTEHKGLVIC